MSKSNFTLSAEAKRAISTAGVAPGIPPLDVDAPPTSFFEFWKPDVFYLPMKLYALWLAIKYRGATLPTVSNPLIEYGGLVGESKDQIDSLIPQQLRQYFPKHTAVSRSEKGDVERELQAALAHLREADIGFPCIAKPDVGCRGAGVQRIENAADLRNFIQDFPSDEKIVLQEIIDYPGEAGVFYIRYPGEEKGRIFSLTLKYFPHVLGDGKSTLRQLIESDWRAGALSHIYLERHTERLEEVLPEGALFRIAYAGSHSRGTIFRNGNALINPKMEAFFDHFSQQIPEFYFGRIDVRFQNATDLEDGENLKVLEINGAGGEATHIWDSKTSLWEAYRVLAAQYDALYKIGALNRKRGFKPIPFSELMAAVKHHDRLMVSYPTTH